MKRLGKSATEICDQRYARGSVVPLQVYLLSEKFSSNIERFRALAVLCGKQNAVFWCDSSRKTTDGPFSMVNFTGHLMCPARLNFSAFDASAT
jgi:hypothetical protein